MIVTHKQADVDAFSSALALKRLIVREFGSQSGEIKVVFPESISSEAERLEKVLLSKQENFEYLNEINEVNGETIIILDTASESQLPNFQEILKGYTFLIDHHYYNSIKKFVSEYYIDRTAYSTSELIASIFPEGLLDEATSCLLLAGIVFDTNRFKRSSESTFICASKLSSRCNYNKLISEIETREEDVSKRMAKLKALQRLSLLRKGELIIAMTHVSSFESDVASSILREGADISLVISDKDFGLRIVLRSKSEVEDEVLRKIREVVERLAEGKFGGHRESMVLESNIRIEKREIESLMKKIKEELQPSLGAE
ncbi:phosphoesterase, RecJ domain protein [Fervidicoccus fontis Kam940]|uniref:Phosphoesterase, RecJ domain protein n=1 Tax=Fervidicoccus fontis (strain DSM 19380 / JCM 18336 / VKM B-2539 / Kam940) TaxID=1163730 RepID=I0A2X7_FERFK|nr:phosphoesterase, RecJ domain protein [Fervidicoccus fontis Kam940]